MNTYTQRCKVWLGCYRSELKSKTSIDLYFGVAAAVILPAYAAMFVLSEYLQRDRFARLVSFYSADAPGNVSPSCLPRPLGVHYFGDLVSVLCHAKHPSPYLASDATNYFPVTYVLMRPLAWISDVNFTAAVFVFVALLIALILLPIYKVLRRSEMSRPYSALLLGVMMTQPLISLIDRGNVQMLVTGFVILGFYFRDNPRSLVSPVLLGLATAMKGYPLIFQLTYVRARQWKQFIVSIMTTVLATGLSLWFFSGGLIENVKAMVDKVLVFREGQNMWLRYNSSLKALLLSMQELQLSEVSTSVSGLLLRNYTVMVAVMALAIVVQCLRKPTTEATFLLLACVFSTLLLDLTATYVLTLFFVLFAVNPNILTEDKTTKVPLLFLAMMMAPKGISLVETMGDHSTSLTSLINPLLLVMIMISCFWPREFRLSRPSSHRSN